MDYFYSIDESIELSKNLTEEDVVRLKFKKAYWRSFSGQTLIRDADGSEFSSKFDKKNMEFICIAVPKDYKPRKQRMFTEETEVIDRLELLKKQYDFIDEDAFLFGCEDYDEEMFIHPNVCQEMWKLGVRLHTITGWAYYAMTSKNVSLKKNVVVPIKARPLLSKEFSSSIYNFNFFSEAYLKRDFPEIADISVYTMRKLGANGIKKAVNTLVLKQDSYSCLKIIRNQGKNTKVIFCYYNDDAEKAMKEVKQVIGDSVLEFDYELYMKDNSNRIIIEKEDAERMLEDLKAYKNKIEK